MRRSRTGREDLDPHHQNDQEHRQLHCAVDDAIGTEGQRGGGAQRDAGIGDPARERVGGEHPHRAFEQRPSLVGEQAGAGSAVAEGLERGEPLDRVKELGTEGAVGVAASEAVALVPTGGNGRCDQREQRKADQHRRHRQVEEGDDREYAERCQGGDAELGQILAEVGFELLDPIDDREHHIAGPLQTEVRGPERDYLVVQQRAEMELHHRRGVVGVHGAGVFQEPTQHHDSRHADERPGELGKGGARKDGTEKPTEERQAAHPGCGRGKAEEHAHADAQPDASGERPETAVEEHMPGRSGSDGRAPLL